MSSKRIYLYRHKCDSCGTVVELDQCSKIPKLPTNWESVIVDDGFQDLCYRCALNRKMNAADAKRDKELGIEWCGAK